MQVMIIGAGDSVGSTLVHLSKKIKPAKGASHE
jgi:hypothetical protein